ncbi:hypothetical protein F2Q70_00022408 [Brassica cretica]|uniref:Uncharacterized protein n=1 Tax=Brassica cretica TaxID=69181 RepID=A0A8S9GQ05_BRACR|nr:hypothetical protein F2Q70_00022408 [Brassica cretica]
MVKGRATGDASSDESCNEMRKQRGKLRQNKIIKLWSCPRAMKESIESKISYNVKLRGRDLTAGKRRMIYTADSWTLNKILFPQALIGSTRSADTAKIDHDLTSKKLLYAANWTMEQEEDIQLYLHPIWSHISSCRKHLKSLCKLDPDAFPIPMMSSKLIDIAASNEQSKPLSKTLFESLSSVGVLRLTYQQWLAENNYNHTDVSSFIRFLDSLRALEKKILSEIVGSPSFTVSIQLYIEVIEKHSFFWSDLVSSSDECKLFFFWSLIKAIKKLDSSFPEEVHVVLEESKNINNIALHGEPESLYYGHMGAILPCRFLQSCTLSSRSFYSSAAKLGH